MNWLAGIYLSLGAAYLDTPPAPPCPACYWYYDINRVRNPFGVAELGYTHDWDNTSVDLAIRHESSVATSKDHGMNSVELRFKWRPFK